MSKSKTLTMPATVLVKGPNGQPRQVILDAGESLPSDAIEGEAKRLEGLGAFTERKPARRMLTGRGATENRPETPDLFAPPAGYNPDPSDTIVQANQRSTTLGQAMASPEESTPEPQADESGDSKGTKKNS